MSKTFSKLTHNKLDLQDKLPKGKFINCRVCDIIEDEFEYLTWLHRKSIIHFTKPVLSKLHQLAAYKASEEFFKNEIEPYLKTDFEDIPF